MKQKIFKYIIIFVILIVSYNALLFISSLFPSTLIEENVKESAETLYRECDLFNVRKGIAVDNYTDAIMINTAYSIDNNNPFESYMLARKNYKDGLTLTETPDIDGELYSIPHKLFYLPCTELKDFINGKITTSIEYARYWHGYLPVLRTLLIFFNIDEIRAFNIITLAILFVILIFMIYKEFGKWMALFFAFSFFIYDYFFVGLSLQNTPVFIVIMIASILMMIIKKKEEWIMYFFFIIGSITNFVDFLTVPLLSCLIPLTIYIYYKQSKGIHTKELIIDIIKCGFVWGIGYILTFVSKWLICDLFLHKQIFSLAVGQVIYRTVKPNENTVLTLREALRALYTLFGLFLSTFVFIFTIKALTLRNNYKLIGNWFKQVIPYLLVGVIPFIWYLALSNHTVLHVHFIYRLMIISLLSLLICTLKLLKIKKKEKTSEV